MTGEISAEIAAIEERILCKKQFRLYEKAALRAAFFCSLYRAMITNNWSFLLGINIAKHILTGIYFIVPKNSL